MKVRARARQWLHYGGDLLAPLCRRFAGSITPVNPWRHYAEDLVAPLRRRRIGSIMPAIHMRPLIRDDAERAQISSAFACGSAAFCEDIMLDTADRPRWFATVINPVFDVAGTWTQTVHVFTDCTLIKIRETVQQQMMEAMASEMPISDIMLIACREFEYLAPNVGISIFGVDEGGRLRTLAAPSIPDNFSEAVDGRPIGPMSGACGAAAFGGEAVLVSNIACDPRTTAFKDLLLPLGIRSCWSSPIPGRNGRVLGTFAF